MTKKVVLFLVIIACLAGLWVLNCWEREPPPPPLPNVGPGGGNPEEENDREKAPDFTLRDLAGNKVSLSDFRGKVVLINFWSSHCPPCILEMPSLTRLNDAMTGKPFKLLAITDDPPSIAEKVARRLNLNFTILPDPQSTVAQRYGVYFAPVTIVVLPDGTISNRFIGAANWSDPMVIKYLEALAQLPSTPNSEQ